MKIHEYNEMMAYLTRPAMNTGERIGFYSGSTADLETSINKLKQYNDEMNLALERSLERKRQATASIVDYFQNKLGINLSGKEQIGDLKELIEFTENLSEEKIKKTYDK